MEDREKISTNNFRIEKNIVCFSDLMIQISNISQINIAPIPKKKYNLWLLLIMFLGFPLIQMSEILQMIGVVLVVVGISYVVYIIIINNNESKYLNIYLNSGNIYSIICRDTKFLTEVMHVMEYCINNHSSQVVQIDFQNCKMFNSPVTVGNRNVVG